MAGKNVSDIFAGGHHSWFSIDYENPIIEDYLPPSPLELSVKSKRSSKSRKSKKSKNFLNQNSSTDKRHKKNSSRNFLNDRNPPENVFKDDSEDDSE